MDAQFKIKSVIFTSSEDFCCGNAFLEGICFSLGFYCDQLLTVALDFCSFFFSVIEICDEQNIKNVNYLLK